MGDEQCSPDRCLLGPRSACHRAIPRTAAVVKTSRHLPTTGSSWTDAPRRESDWGGRGATSGFDIVRRLHEDGVARSRLILISSHSPDDFADLIAESPAIGFVSKSRLNGRRDPKRARRSLGRCRPAVMGHVLAADARWALRWEDRTRRNDEGHPMRPRA
jgi:hypothetical protein